MHAHQKSISPDDIAAQGHVYPLSSPSSLLTHALYHMYASHFGPPHTYFLVLSPRHILKYRQSQHLLLQITSPSAIASSLHVPANSISHPRDTALSSGVLVLLGACCGLQVFSCTSYCSGGAHYPGTHPTKQSKKKQKKTPLSLPPEGCVCESSRCAVPASCHANAPQLWRRRLPQQVAVGDITGLQVSL